MAMIVTISGQHVHRRDFRHRFLPGLFLGLLMMIFTNSSQQAGYQMQQQKASLAEVLRA
jgi:hypothetical protein